MDLAQSESLNIAADLKGADGENLTEGLAQELRRFHVKIDLRTGHDTYDAWREREHDDLVPDPGDRSLARSAHRARAFHAEPG